MANTEDLKSSELNALVGSSPTSGTNCNHCWYMHEGHTDMTCCKCGMDLFQFFKKVAQK